MSNLAIIPARGGSKRIPGKNIKLFLGKPIISYSIEAAINSELFSEIMVSTDDEAIAEIAVKYGANVPFIRTGKNADDFATLADVLTEVLRCYEEAGQYFDKVCCILPTAPLVSFEKIIQAYQKMKHEGWDSLTPVVQYSYPIYRALKIGSDERLSMIWPENIRMRSQDLDLAYHDSGSFYFVDVKAFLKEQSLFCEKGTAIFLSDLEVQDIDTNIDWRLAELKYQILNG